MKFPSVRLQIPGKTYSVGTLTYTFRGLVGLFAWMLWGDFCFTLMESVVPSIVPLKLRGLDSPNVLIGLIMFTLPSVFNIGITPALSFKSDRLRSRWGRRIPYILATMPFLVLMLVLLGFTDDIGKWTYTHFFSNGRIGQAQVIVVLLALFAIGFDFFNMFVNTVYWYLFVDIVPPEMMGRFTGWFRVVGNLAGALYQIFIFKYAETYTREIFLGAALLYFVGFGAVCLNVKEGEYPPIDDGVANPNLWDDICIYARECFAMRFYWDFFLTYSFRAFANSILIFQVFFSKSLGLDLGTIGSVGGYALITGAVWLVWAGPFVDKCHPVRVMAYIDSLELLTFAASWVWVFVGTAPPAAWYLAIVTLVGAVFSAPFGAVRSIGDATRIMLLLPRGQYGQFSGAMALVRAVAIMLGGIFAGLYVDAWHRVFPAGYYCYRFNFIWLLVFFIISFYFQYRNYRAWKRLGGVTSYVAPTKGFQLHDLAPFPGDNGQLEKKLVWLSAWLFIGMQATALSWFYVYSFVRPDRQAALVFFLSIGVNFLLYALYLRFIRFMERP